MFGSILFNGNIIKETDFVYKFQDRILQSNHIDPVVKERKKALLITGAWGKEEFQESHIKEALKDIGIPSHYKNGFDENIQNLCVYHEWMQFQEKHLDVQEMYLGSLNNLFKIKTFYHERNAELVNLLQHHVRIVKKEFPYLSLSDFFSYNASEEEWRVPQMSDRDLLMHYSCLEMQKTMSFLVSGDELQAKISSEIQDYAKIRSGLPANQAYHIKRKELIDRILSSNSIFIFGGDVASLYYSLKFWELEWALSEALVRGTNFYTVSAGSIVLCNKIIVYVELPEKNGNKSHQFVFFDNGMGLVRKIKLFPHCRDRIQTDDPDNLAYLAHRFQGRACVGLNEESFLLMDAERGPNGRIYPKYTSVGEKDGVYVFDLSGKKICVNCGDQLMVPGTLLWEKNLQQTRKIEKAKSLLSQYAGSTLWNDNN